MTSLSAGSPMPEYKVGELVYDNAACLYGVIIETCPQLSVENGDNAICFDYTVLSSGDIFFADSDELEKVRTVDDERGWVVGFSNVGNCHSR